MTYDLIVLGGGPGGYNASERAAAKGLSVACVERAALGGVCLNEGCIPTKTLLYSAKLHDGAAHGEKYGVTAQGLALDHAKVMARKSKVVRTLVAGVKAALKGAGVQVIGAEGCVLGTVPDGFAVQAGEEKLLAKNLLLATGSSAAVPPLDGLQQALDSGFALTAGSALQLQEIPRRLVVIGGGVIGLEFASYFASAGSSVQVLEMLGHVAGENDPELSAVLQKNYEKKGVGFALEAKVTRVEANGVWYQKDGEDVFAEADKVLVSVGRRPNTTGLGLESIGVQCQRGAVLTNERMQTNVPGVYAAGDINGKSMLAHTAYREGEVAVNNLLGLDDEMDYMAVPAVIYTNPELAAIGYTEAAAAAAGLEAEVLRLPMRFSGRYLAENEGGDGIFKLLIDKKSHTVLGAHALGNYSSEFISVLSGFIAAKMPVEQMRKVVFPHPTVGEIIREALFQYKGE